MYWAATFVGQSQAMSPRAIKYQLHQAKTLHRLQTRHRGKIREHNFASAHCDAVERTTIRSLRIPRARRQRSPHPPMIATTYHQQMPQKFQHLRTPKHPKFREHLTAKFKKCGGKRAHADPLPFDSQQLSMCQSVEANIDYHPAPTSGSLIQPIQCSRPFPTVGGSVILGHFEPLVF